MASKDLDTECPESEALSRISGFPAGTMDVPPELVQVCRDYLLLVANRNLDQELQRKLGASDLVQETFLHAQRSFDQFRGSSLEELLAWLRKILLNHLIDETRKFRATDKRRINRERPLLKSDDSRWPSRELSSTEKSPPAIAIENEEFAALSHAMERLPADYRQVIQLRTWERLPFPEVGHQMSRSTDAVRKLWVRAIERLERELDRSDER